MNTKSDTSRHPNPLWAFFRSLRLTLFLLIALAVVSIFGTVIPQQEGAMEFARRLSPGLVNLLSSLQLFDMYHSIWFRIIIALLVLNLIFCSLDRLPGTLRRFRAAPRPDRSGIFENLPADRSVRVNGDLESVTGRVEEILRSGYRGVTRKDTPGGNFLYAEKGRYSLFGVYLVHLSVLLILLGGIVGSFLGFEAYVAIPEGEAAEQVTVRKTGAKKTLPFAVACDKFTVKFYKNGTPMEYRSDLVFFEDGRKAREGQLMVNHPVTFRGITFYQSNYGSIPGDRVLLKITRKGSDQEDFTLEARRGDEVPLPGKEGKFQVLDVHADLRDMMGPAALISVRPDRGGEHRFWVFQDFESVRRRLPAAMLQSPKLNPSAFEPYTFSLKKIDSRYYTGLQVSRDPGVPLVWAGFVLIVVGLFSAFFSSHRRVWIRVLREGGEVGISMAGKSAKNPAGAEREIEQLAGKIREKVL